MKLHRPMAGLAFVAVMAVSVLMAPLAFARVVAEGTFERSLAVTGPVDLGVETGSGSISVRAGESGRVRIVGTIKVHSTWGLGRGDAEERVRRLVANPPIEQSGNTIRIGKIRERALRENVSISYEITVPRETRLSSTSGSGSQTIHGLRGPVQVETGSGSVNAGEIGGQLVASTGSGSIRATGVAGPVRVRTGSGSVRLALTAPGDVNVETGSGRVEVTGLRGALRVDTGSGSVNVDGLPTGDWKLTTGSGGVSITLPSEAGFELTAHTGSGRIYSDHPILVQGNIGTRELRGTVRGGGVLVAVSTGSGNIRIR